MPSNDVVFVASVSLLACTAGATGAYIWTKKHMTAQYELLIEEEVKKAHDFYSQRAQLAEENDVPEPSTLVEAFVDEVELTEVSPEEAKELALERENFVNYNKIATKYGSEQFGRSTSVKPHEGESQEDFEQRLIDEAKSFTDSVLNRVEPELMVEEPEEEIISSNLFNTHGESNENDLDHSLRTPERPYIISNEEYEDEELGYSQNTLTYYEKDAVLVDERDQPVQKNQVVGDTNLRFGNASGDMNIVYIRNDRLEADFEVVRSYSSYAEEVLGVGSPKNKGLG